MTVNHQESQVKLAKLLRNILKIKRFDVTVATDGTDAIILEIDDASLLNAVQKVFIDLGYTNDDSRYEFTKNGRGSVVVLRRAKAVEIRVLKGLDELSNCDAAWSEFYREFKANGLERDSSDLLITDSITVKNDYTFKAAVSLLKKLNYKLLRSKVKSIYERDSVFVVANETSRTFEFKTAIQ